MKGLFIDGHEQWSGFSQRGIDGLKQKQEMQSSLLK